MPVWRGVSQRVSWWEEIAMVAYSCDPAMVVLVLGWGVANSDDDLCHLWFSAAVDSKFCDVLFHSYTIVFSLIRLTFGLYSSH